MSPNSGLKISNTAQHDTAYLGRRLRDETDAATDARSLSATLIHVALATAYAKRCCSAADQAWLAETRLW